MLPSRRLIILVLAAGPIFLAGALFEPLAAIGAVYVLLLLLWAAADAATLTRRRQIEIGRVVPQRISIGVPSAAALAVHNRSRRRVEVRLAEDLPEGLAAHPARCVGVFGPGARGTLSYRLLARRRGRYALRRLDVRVLPQLGLFWRQFRHEAAGEFDVYPNLANMKRYDLLLRRGLTHEAGLARLRQIGQGSEFESLRHYTPGDDMSRVEWKATAKRAQLVVKNYQPERRQSVLVAVDVGRATAGEFGGISRLDYLVNAALMLAYVALRQGDWFSLVAFSDRVESYLPPVRGVKNVERVARSLYELQPRLVEADVILAYLARFARRHLALAVTLANPELRELADRPLAGLADSYSKAVALDVLAARKEALKAMKQRGVDVLDVAPTALTPELIDRYLLIKATRRL